MKKLTIIKNVLWGLTIVCTIVFLFVLGLDKGNKKIILGIPVCTIIFICRYYINKLNKELSTRPNN